MDTTGSPIILTRQRTNLGLEGNERRGAAEPRLTRVRRGAYVDAAVWERSRPAARYWLLVQATVAAARSEVILSHESAAAALRIPVVGPWPQRVHVVGEVAGGGRSSGLIVRHGVRRLPAVVLVGGQAVTSVARTVLDLARTRTFASGLASADYALATDAITQAELLAELEGMRGTRGYRRARRVVAMADGRSGSVGESLSRAQMHELHLPIPELQRPFFDEDGYVGRTDFWWEERQLIGEFDGKAKYQRDGYAGNTDPAEIVWQEKRREDRLRLLASGLTRWTWADAWDQERFRLIMARAGIRPDGGGP
ncbi:hypothetical protein [Georgenia sp. SYP-B2076]|uniref:hypothetical protein n=1 Tax=Georgenia sp. SYP-B2076 TaxID=2495881 RepID=UPI000F8E7092|nr:hypothetical protein [Georgenia sp. SYP-B2076]